MLSTEIERLNSHLRSKMNEVEEWKNRYITLENNYQIMEKRSKELVSRIGMLTGEIERLSQHLQ